MKLHEKYEAIFAGIDQRHREKERRITVLWGVGMAALLGLAALTLPNCAGSDPYRATGEALNTAGQTFVTTAALFDQALDAHAVTPEQYRAWSAFGRKFQASYPLALQLWQASVRVGDAATAGGARALVAQLVSELAGFYAQVSTLVFPLDAGAP